MSKKELAEQLAAEIAKVPGVASCHVDDWNREQTSFALLATIPGEKQSGKFWPAGGKKYSLVPVIAKIRSILKAHSALIESPRRLYLRGLCENFFEGYESDRIRIDLYPVAD